MIRSTVLSGVEGRSSRSRLGLAAAALLALLLPGLVAAATHACGVTGWLGNVLEYYPAGTLCRAAAGACDSPEYCTGSSVYCPADYYSYGICRSAAGPCDITEYCSGGWPGVGSPYCPSDSKVNAGTVCRASAGLCDVAETCNGTSNYCPMDTRRPATHVCRASAGDCDVAEQCDGYGTQCPANAFVSSSAVCRAAAGWCDVPERCTGTGATCPADRLAAAGSTCRGTQDICDAAESCTGASVSCPTDADAGVCAPAESATVVGWTLGSDLAGVEIAAASGSVWIAPGPSDGVGRLDPDGGELTRWGIPFVGTSLGRIALQERVDGEPLCWVADGDAVGVLDPATATFTRWAVGEAPRALAVDASGHAYFATRLAGGAARISRLDPSADRITAWDLAAGEIATLALDPSGRIHFALQSPSGSDDRVGILDPTTGSVTTWPLSSASELRVGADGDAFFCEAGGAATGRVARLSSTQGVLSEWSVPGACDLSVALHPRGHLFLSQTAALVSVHTSTPGTPATLAPPATATAAVSERVVARSLVAVKIGRTQLASTRQTVVGRRTGALRDWRWPGATLGSLGADALGRVYAADAGNGTIAVVTIEFPPAPALLSILPDQGPFTGGSLVTIAGSGFQDGATVVIGGIPATVTSLSPGSISATTGAAPRSMVADVVVTNPDGQSVTVAAAYTYRPAATLDASPSVATLGAPVTLTWSVLGADVVKLANDVDDTKYTLETTGNLVVHPSRTTTYALVGRSSETDVGFRRERTVTVAAPEVRAVAPLEGPALGGIQITLHGSRFGPGATVTFGGVPALDVVREGESAIVATLPAHPVGSADVTVTNADGQSSTLVDGFAFVDGIGVAAVEPASGPVEGGTAVTITGTNFQPGATARFGGVAAVTTAVLGPTSLVAVAPAGVEGPVDVEVVSASGAAATLVSGYTYVETRTKLTLGVTVAGTGTGTVTGAGITCTFATCSAAVAQGTTVTLTAAEDAGSIFRSWSGCTSVSGRTCTVSMTAARAVTATFLPASYTLSANVFAANAGGTVVGAGLDCRAGGAGTCAISIASTYPSYTTVELAAVADAGSRFAYWSGCTSASGTTCSVTLSGARSVTAYFQPQDFTLSARISGAAGAGGSIAGAVTCGPSSSATCATQVANTHPAYTSVQLTASPDASSRFAYWSGCTSVSGATCTVTVGSARTVIAYFQPKDYALNARIAGSGGAGGSIGGAVTCGPSSSATCVAPVANTYPQHTSVQLTATPDGRSRFAYWTGCASVSGSVCSVTVDGTRTVTAFFQPTEYPLSVNVAGLAGAGGSVGGAVTCGPSSSATCTAPIPNTHPSFTGVQLTATPDESSVFAGWSGCTSVSGTTCDVTVSGAHLVTATFQPKSFTLTARISGSGGASGSVHGAVPCGPASSATCGAPIPNTHPAYTTVQLTPAAAAGSRFEYWSGCTSVSGTTCNVTVSRARTVSAYFQPSTYPLTVRTGGTGQGTVTGEGISCTSPSSGACSGSFANGGIATLTASPASNSTLTSWYGCTTATGNTCQVALTSARSVTAVFQPSATVQGATGESLGVD